MPPPPSTRSKHAPKEPIIQTTIQDQHAEKTGLKPSEYGPVDINASARAAHAARAADMEESDPQTAHGIEEDTNMYQAPPIKPLKQSKPQKRSHDDVAGEENSSSKKIVTRHSLLHAPDTDPSITPLKIAGYAKELGIEWSVSLSQAVYRKHAGYMQTATEEAWKIYLTAYTDGENAAKAMLFDSALITMQKATSKLTQTTGVLESFKQDSSSFLSDLSKMMNKQETRIAHQQETIPKTTFKMPKAPSNREMKKTITDLRELSDMILEYNPKFPWVEISEGRAKKMSYVASHLDEIDASSPKSAFMSFDAMMKSLPSK